MFNKIILVGNLTKDVELRTIPSGVSVATLRIASNTRYKQNGESKEDVLFIDTVVFGKQAEACAEYLTKGSPILIEGRLRERKWESEGVQKSKLEITANAIRFLGKKKDTNINIDSNLIVTEDAHIE
jgi:single-strand DNA-binding protein